MINGISDEEFKSRARKHTIDFLQKDSKESLLYLLTVYRPTLEDTLSKAFKCSGVPYNFEELFPEVKNRINVIPKVNSSTDEISDDDDGDGDESTEDDDESTEDDESNPEQLDIFNKYGIEVVDSKVNEITSEHSQNTLIELPTDFEPTKVGIDADNIRELVYYIGERERLKELIKKEGYVTYGSKGDARIHPLVTMLQKYEITIARIKKEVAYLDNLKEKNKIINENKKVGKVFDDQSNNEWEEFLGI
jgi:hypothetical protein